MAANNLPPTDEELLAVVEANAAYRTKVDAARSLNLAISTYKHRLLLAEMRGLTKARNESGEAYAVPDGHVVKGESTLIDAKGNILVQWIKTRETNTGEQLVESLKAVFAEFGGKSPKLTAPSVSDDDLLTVYPIPDLHFGMHAWKPETGDSDYDIKIASQIANNSIATLVAQSRPSKRAVVLGLGDYFHANDRRDVTPASGHALDSDGRWPKVIREGAKLAVDIVNLVAVKHSEVEVVFVQGNHDPDSSIALTVALSLFYSNNQRITVKENANVIWWHQFGQCLLCATHGHTMKAEKLAMAVAADRPKEWGATEFRHGFMGHIHHETATGREVAGMRVESFQSPAPRDAYNAAAGYRSGRSLSAITFHKEMGEIGRHRVNIVEQP